MIDTIAFKLSILQIVTQAVSAGRFDCVGETLAFGNDLGVNMLHDQATFKERHDTIMTELKMIKEHLVRQKEQMVKMSKKSKESLEEWIFTKYTKLD